MSSCCELKTQRTVGSNGCVSIISTVVRDGKTYYSILKGFEPDRPVPKAGKDENPNYAAERAQYEVIMARSRPP